ncbi:transient receptor potential cation channel subfamily M member 6 [Elysia marginata]|uniref:Transient receptor potential cation channel subfamily M member 6 n=1 Tax=Elysia marginata TaxID=1093978 RepID=A0AAV4IG54_9GAST|nr:transient receptor potential cation channel subfamily M member 6 [Elysia marginata]
MASGGVRIHPAHDMGGRMFGAGGPSMSRQSELEMYNVTTSSKASKSLTLEEAYWTDRQRKVGLVRATRQADALLEDDYSRMKAKQIEFVRQRFHRFECQQFVPVTGQVGNGKKCKAKMLKCHCGETLANHDAMRNKAPGEPYFNSLVLPRELAKRLKEPNEIITEELPKLNITWNAEDCLVKSSTNAFGKIDFNVEQVGGKKPAKYIRLCPDDSVDDCFQLMNDFWHIMEPEPPHLVISVVGGAKNFKLDGRLRDTFSTGLIKAAKTTKAWLITSGFNMGVMKSVGQAVHEGQTFKWDKDRMSHVLRSIGIAPWGYVRGRHVLESNGSVRSNN